MGIFSWIGDKVSSRWHDIWDDGYNFGDIIRSINAPMDGIVSGAMNDIGSGLSDVFSSDTMMDFGDQLQTGVKNWWYKTTGQSHLTDEYKHEEEMEAKKNQITAEDMMKAGLSKFGMSATGFSAPSASNGLTMLDGLAKAQQIKAQGLALKEQRYNFGIAKKLGIRTGDKNVYAPLIALAKGLFGVDVDDIPEEGLIPYLLDKIKEGFGSGDGSEAGAFADAVGNIFSEGTRASSVSDPGMFVNLPKALATQGMSIGVSQEVMNKAVQQGLENAGLETTPPSLESKGKSLGVFSDDFKIAANSFVQTMVNDKMVSTDNLDLLAHQLSKRYNISVDEVRKYLTDLVRELR